MMKISILFLSIFLFCTTGIHMKSFSDRFKDDREIRSNDYVNSDTLFDNNAYFPSSYMRMAPLMYENRVFKRSILPRHSVNRRQTPGIIYGNGKPIGILQPFQESFKFLPIREERSLEDGKVAMGMDPELMYPLTRIARSEEEVRMKQLEAAKAEFIDKHYPSMLVDFKLHDKLHSFDKKSPSFGVNSRASSKNGKEEEKREIQATTLSSKLNSKRENLRNARDNRAASKTDQSIKKREILKKSASAKVEKRQNSHSDKGRKRETILSDAQFESLKRIVAKRHSKDAQLIEEDLKNILTDMGLIEDDLEENADKLNQKRNVPSENEKLNENDNTPTSLKEKSENKRGIIEIQTNDDRNKRDRGGENYEEDAKEDSSVDKSRNQENVDQDTSSDVDKNDQSNVIPNKREASDSKNGEKSDDKRSDDVMITTESYEQYEERVAREIRAKIKQLKEEVRNELGALEDDNEEEEDEEEGQRNSFGEAQRRRRSAQNTLMDEESKNIDPNANLDAAQLAPHIRRRRMLSIDSAYDENPDFTFADHPRDQSIRNSRYRKSNTKRFNNDALSNDNFNFRWDENGMYYNDKNYARNRNSRKYALADTNKRSSQNNMKLEYEDADIDSDYAEISPGAVSFKNVDPKITMAQPNARANEDLTELRNLPGNNQKYYYYYVGNNGADKRENSRGNSAQFMPYYQQRTAFPGYYRAPNRLQSPRFTNRVNNVGNVGTFNRMNEKYERQKRQAKNYMVVPAHGVYIADVPRNFSIANYRKNFWTQIRRRNATREVQNATLAHDKGKVGNATNIRFLRKEINAKMRNDRKTTKTSPVRHLERKRKNYFYDNCRIQNNALEHRKKKIQDRMRIMDNHRLNHNLMVRSEKHYTTEKPEISSSKKGATTITNSEEFLNPINSNYKNTSDLTNVVVGSNFVNDSSSTFDWVKYQRNTKNNAVKNNLSDWFWPIFLQENSENDDVTMDKGSYTISEDELDEIDISNSDRRKRRADYYRNAAKRRSGYEEEPQQLLTEISELELFGSLPQSYTGELARYKRVKKGTKDDDDDDEEG